MLSRKAPFVIDCFRLTNLGIGANSVVFQGGSATYNGIIDARRTPYLKFTLYADTILTFDIEGSMDAATFIVMETVAGVAGAHTDTYNLAAPRGEIGWYVTSMPFVRLRLTNGAVATTTLYCFATFSSSM